MSGRPAMQYQTSKRPPAWGDHSILREIGAPAKEKQGRPWDFGHAPELSVSPAAITGRVLKNILHGRPMTGSSALLRKRKESCTDCPTKIVPLIHQRKQPH